ncbi:hypothetical protein GGI42DRAFT_269813 [Trichoderma sp. SZMC 28013]
MRVKVNITANKKHQPASPALHGHRRWCPESLRLASTSRVQPGVLAWAGSRRAVACPSHSASSNQCLLRASSFQHPERGTSDVVHIHPRRPQMRRADLGTPVTCRDAASTSTGNVPTAPSCGSPRTKCTRLYLGMTAPYYAQRRPSSSTIVSDPRNSVPVPLAALGSEQTSAPHRLHGNDSNAFRYTELFITTPW